MTQAPLHTALLALGAVLGLSLVMISACSKAQPPTVTSTTSTTVAAVHPHPTAVTPNAPAISAASDLTQTAAVSPPGDRNGKLPPTPGEREPLATARDPRPR